MTQNSVVFCDSLSKASRSKSSQNNLLYAIIGLMITITISNASTPLSGIQDGSYGPDTFVVSGIVEIPYDKKLIFEPGSLVKFDKYSGIIVEGTLLCTGETTRKVVFTNNSESDSALWSGIVLTSLGTTKLKNVEIKNSQIGLKVPNFDKNVVLNNVDFVHNRSGFVIGKKVVLQNDALNFSFGQDNENTLTINKNLSKLIVLVIISLVFILFGILIFKPFVNYKWFKNKAKQASKSNKVEMNDILDQNPPTSFVLPQKIKIDTHAFKNPEIALNIIMNSFQFYRDHLNEDYKDLSKQASTSFKMWVIFGCFGLAQVSSGFLFIYCDKFKEGAFTTVSTAVSFFILKFFQQREDHYRNLANKKHTHLEFGNKWMLMIQSINILDDPKNKIKMQIKLLQSLITNLHFPHSEKEEKKANPKKQE
jgi:hypothetical protein